MSVKDKLCIRNNDKEVVVPSVIMLRFTLYLAFKQFCDTHLFSTPCHQDFSKELLEDSNTEDINDNNNFSLQDRVPLLTAFWNDPSVQTCYDQRNLFYIDDSAK